MLNTVLTKASPKADNSSAKIFRLVKWKREGKELVNLVTRVMGKGMHLRAAPD